MGRAEAIEMSKLEKYKIPTRNLEYGLSYKELRDKHDSALLKSTHSTKYVNKIYIKLTIPKNLKILELKSISFTGLTLHNVTIPRRNCSVLSPSALGDMKAVINL